jgi:hypothetical protein
MLSYNGLEHVEVYVFDCYLHFVLVVRLHV